MKTEIGDILYMNDLIRCYDYSFGYDNEEIDTELDWYSNYQLSKLIIELKTFLDENNIDYQPDIVNMYKKYLEEVGTEEYAKVTFADYVVCSVFSELDVSIRLCIDDIEDLKEMYEEYMVYPYLFGIGIDIYQDFYTLSYSPDGYSYDNIDGAESDYEDWCREYLCLDDEEEINIYDHLDELINYVDGEVVRAISEGRLTDFVWFEPYKFVEMLNSLGVIAYEAAFV